MDGPAVAELLAGVAAAVSRRAAAVSEDGCGTAAPREPPGSVTCFLASGSM